MCACYGLHLDRQDHILYCLDAKACQSNQRAIEKRELAYINRMQQFIIIFIVVISKFRDVLLLESTFENIDLKSKFTDAIIVTKQFYYLGRQLRISILERKALKKEIKEKTKEEAS